MGFLAWHYSKGFEFYIHTLTNVIDGVIHNFSFPLLLKTLFAPWKRQVVIEDKPGFDIGRFFENLTFNLISRGVGFVVRIALIITGVVVLVTVALFGILGLLVWTIFPPIGIPFYLKYTKKPERFIKHLLAKLLSTKGESQLKALFENTAGSFLLTHLGVSSDVLIKNAKIKGSLQIDTKIESYEALVKIFVDAGYWEDDFLRKQKIGKDDIVFAAKWWDDRRKMEATLKSIGSGPGLALGLIYGYTPNLNNYTVDLTIPQDFSHHLIGREQIVSRMERILNADNSVIVVGQPGVGKKTVVLEFARRARAGELGQKMAYRRILELDYNSLLSSAQDLNLKKATFQAALTEASMAGNVILIIRDIHRITNFEVEGFDFTDVLEELLEEKELKIVAIGTNTDYERFIAPNMRIRKFLEKVDVVPATKEEALEIVRDAATDWEVKKNLVVLVSALRKILDGSDKYITETPFPEKALELLDAAVEYLEKEEGNVVNADIVDKVLSEKTGISFARITQREKDLLGNLENIVHETLINQESAVKLIAKSLRARTVGIAKEDKPLGSFLFLGPTGVGKTETAKVLAKIYYESEESMIRFDMAQYASKDGLKRLIGSKGDNQPGDLTTAIKNNPASLLLLDEIEKAGREIHNLLLTILDEGYVIDAFGKKINCKHLFLIGTSNAAANYVWEQVKKGMKGETLQRSVVDYTLSKSLFTPEFINRFDGVVVYEPLSNESLVKIAALMLNSLKDNIKKKGIDLKVADGVAVKLAKDGYDPAFGARPMRRIVDLDIGDMLGRAILKDEVKEGDRIKLVAKDKEKEFGWEKIK